MKTLCLLAFVVACQSAVVKPVDSAPGPIVTAPSSCEAACDTLRNLHCAEGDSLATTVQCADSGDCRQDGQECSNGTCVVPCEMVCDDNEKRGIGLNLSCVAQISECTGVEQCGKP